VGSEGGLTGAQQGQQAGVSLNWGGELPTDKSLSRESRSLLRGDQGDSKGLVGLREGQVLERMLQSGAGQLL